MSVTRVPCFMVTRSDVVTVGLRRFTFGEQVKCPKTTYGHDAFRTIFEQASAADWLVPRDDGKIESRDDKTPAPIDERWPLLCDACGGELPPESHRQLWVDPLYAGAPDGKLYAAHERRSNQRRLPAGAIFDAAWYHDIPKWCGPDGRSLMCMLPDGVIWHVDCPSSDGGKWTRSGEPPRLTVTPSIRSPRYHGFLTDGVLVACGDSQA